MKIQCNFKDIDNEAAFCPYLKYFIGLLNNVHGLEIRIRYFFKTKINDIFVYYLKIYTTLTKKKAFKFLSDDTVYIP